MLTLSRFAGQFVSHKSSRLSIVLISLIVIAGCGGGGGGSDDESDLMAGPVTPNTPNAVTISGYITGEDGGVEGVGITAYRSASDLDEYQSDTTSGPSGEYAISVLKDTNVYLQFAKDGYTTSNTKITTFTAETTGIDSPLLAVDDAESIVDAAFGGMMLGLADKAWLAVDVLAADGTEVDGIAVTTSPGIAGGGALGCDGSLTGGNYTNAQPPCRDGQRGTMYLAYFDENTEVSVFAGDGTSVTSAPVRLGELTHVVVEWLDTSVPTSQLEVQVEAGGTVQTNPGYFRCVGPAICNAQVPIGTEVTITANTSEGFELDDWDGCDQEFGAQCVVTVQDGPDNFVRAEFDRVSGPVQRATLTVEVGVGGFIRSRPADVIQCIGPAVCTAEVAVGSIVTLEASPGAGFSFDDWDGCDQEEQLPPVGSLCYRTIIGNDPNHIEAEFD